MKLIKEFKENDLVTSYGQLQSKQIRLKRNGDPYLRVVLADRSGRLEARLWDGFEEFDKEAQEGDFVKYKGLVQTYNGKKQAVVKQIRKIQPEDAENGFDPEDLVPQTDQDVEGMWKSLNTQVQEHVSDPFLLELLTNVLAENEEAIKSYPAGVEIHHSYVGGFLEHVLSLLENALFFAGRYPQLNKSLLVAGVVLHDMGKLEELSGPSSPSYTDQGQLIGHVVLGYGLVQREVAKIPAFPDQLLMVLQHLILSHQGRPEWGSPQQPKTLEALILHYLDDLDSKLNRVGMLLREDCGDAQFTPYDRFLGRAVFKGGGRR